MAIKTSDLNAKLFGKANKRRVATPQEAQTAAKEQAQVIELSVAGEELVSFELVRIPASEVSTRTVVFEENAREQSFLNEHALSDVLTTLKERGQQYPAVGRKNKDGKIEFLMVAVVVCHVFWPTKSSLSMLLRILTATMLNSYLMLQTLTNHFLCMRRAKRCKRS